MNSEDFNICIHCWILWGTIFCSILLHFTYRQSGYQWFSRLTCNTSLYKIFKSFPLKEISTLHHTTCFGRYDHHVMQKFSLKQHRQYDKKNGPSLWDTLAHRRDHRHTQHNRKNRPSLWDTLAHRRDHIQTHTTQQEERPITMGYTSSQTGPHTDTHNTTGRTAHHYGIH
jgi:hypothetical protein